MNYHLFYTNISNLCPFLVVNVSKSFWCIEFINYNKTSRRTRCCSGIYHSACSSRVALCNNFKSKFIPLYTLLHHRLGWWLLLLQLNILSRQCFFRLPFVRLVWPEIFNLVFDDGCDKGTWESQKFLDFCVFWAVYVFSWISS